MSITSEDLSICVYQLAEFDHNLIGKVHQMTFPNKEPDLRLDLKCETELEATVNQNGKGQDGDKDQTGNKGQQPNPRQVVEEDNGAAFKNISSISSNATVMKKISTYSLKSEYQTVEKEKKDSSYGRKIPTSSNIHLNDGKSRSAFAASIKIDVTKIFGRSERRSDVQLWVTLEPRSSQNRKTSQNGSIAQYVKFRGVQFVYEKVVGVNKKY